MKTARPVRTVSRRSADRPSGRKTSARRAPVKQKRAPEFPLAALVSSLCASFLVVYVVASFWGTSLLEQSREAEEGLRQRSEVARSKMVILEGESSANASLMSRQDEFQSETADEKPTPEDGNYARSTEDQDQA